MRTEEGVEKRVMFFADVHYGQPHSEFGKEHKMGPYPRVLGRAPTFPVWGKNNAGCDFICLIKRVCDRLIAGSAYCHLSS